MKNKIIILILGVSIFLVFSYFGDNKTTSNTINNNSAKKVISMNTTNKREEKGVFISYIDLEVLKGKSKYKQEKIIDKMLDNIKNFGLNSIILEVRPFSDSIYNSKIYLSSHTIVNNEGDKLKLDILDYFIKKAKSNNISIYAWINPYRIRNINSRSDINKNNYYYKWFGTDIIEEGNGGIYLNPSRKEVLNYITMGLKELCENYNIDGVIYDDYFYPSKTIDLNNYKENNLGKSISSYRIYHINKLLKESYKTIKSVNKNIRFGISPSGNIENNLNEEYLDVRKVLKSNYIDFIIPQLYYGFNNSSLPYEKALETWSNLNVKNKDFYVALSLYKSGTIDKWAGVGKYEWLEESNILKRQIEVSRKINNYKGFYIFRYDYLFKNYSNSNLEKEVINIKKIIAN